MLPPFVGTSPTVPGAMSPFAATIDEVATRFVITAARKSLFDGLLRHRVALRALGFLGAFQWIDGSFVDLLPAEPKDIDVVTFFHRPPNATTDAALAALATKHPALFVPALAKAAYHCDAYFVDLTSAGEPLVLMTRYWYGLFAHRRNQEWRGLVQVPLDSPDDDKALLARVAKMVFTP